MLFYNSIIMKNKSNLENSTDFSSFGISLANRSTIKDSILNFLSKFVSLKIIKIFMEKNFLEVVMSQQIFATLIVHFVGIDL